MRISFFLFLFGFLYLFNIGSYGLIDVDEPRYAEVAREMLESGNWTIPYFNYEVRYDKPIFFYWLEALFMIVFGENEFAARLPSVLMSFCCLAFLYIFLKVFFGKVTALIGVLILMTSFEFSSLSRFSIPDMTLTSFITCSILCFYLGYYELLSSKRFVKEQLSTFTYWYILAFVFLALAVLTKGPVGIVLTFLIIVPFFWWIRKLDYFIFNKSFWVGFFLFLVLVFPWYIAVHKATNGEFTKVFFGLHNFLRFTSVVSGHKGHLWFFIPVVMIGFFPWIFFLPQSIYSIVRKGLARMLYDINHQVSWFVLWWFFVIFIFFSISKTQLLTYVLPLFPAISVVVAIWFKEVISKTINTSGVVLGMGIFFLCSIIGFYIFIFHFDLVLPNNVKGLKLNFELAIFSFILLVGVSMAWASSNKDIFATLYILLTTVFFVYFSLITFVLPKIDLHSQFKLRTFSKSLPKDVIVAIYRTRKPSVNFYARRKIKQINSINNLQESLNQELRFAFVAKKKDLQGVTLKNAYKWGEDNRFVFYTNYPIEMR